MKKVKQLSVMLVLAVLLTNAFGVGIISAQEDEETPTETEEVLDWFDIAAKAIGIEPDALIEALNGGQSIAQVAEDNGVDVQVVIDALVAFENETLTESVTSFVEQPISEDEFFGTEPFDEEFLEPYYEEPYYDDSYGGDSYGDNYYGNFYFYNFCDGGPSYGGFPFEWSGGLQGMPMMPPYDDYSGDEFEWGGGPHGMGEYMMPPVGLEFDWAEAQPPMMDMTGLVLDDSWLSAAAEAIGIEQETLTDALADGQTLAALAEANGVAVETVTEAIQAVIATHIDAGIEAGWLSAEDAEVIREHVAGMVEQFVNAGFSMFGPESFEIVPTEEIDEE